MVLTDLTKLIKKTLRKRTPKTAAQIAFEVTGQSDGRRVSRAIAALLTSGDIAIQGSRPTTYVKP